MRFIRGIVLATVSLAGLLVAFYLVGLDTLLESLTDISWQAIALAMLLIVSNNFFSLLRFRSVLKSFGFTPAWRDSFLAFSIGQASNQILFNIIGQSLSRAAILNSAGVPFGVSVMTTYWERIQAAVILFVLSLASAWYLFLHVSFDLQQGGAYLLSLLGAMAAVAFVLSVTVLWRAGITQRLLANLGNILRFWPSVLLTLASHGCMLLGYIVLLDSLGLQQTDANIVAALVIVMFTASLPISFAGWGIRELSAVQALSAVGVAASIAVAAAVAVGLLSLLLTIILTVLAGLLFLHRKKPSAAAKPAAASDAATGWTSVAIVACALLSATLLYFQIRIPLQQGELTANIADILAATALGTLAYQSWTARTLPPLPVFFLASMAVLSLVLLFALMLGYLAFGSNDWALLNRGLGWPVILGYVAAGTMIVSSAGEEGRRLILSVLITAGTTVALIQLLLLAVWIGDIGLPEEAFVFPLRGYAANPNALAVQMIIAAAAAAAGFHQGLMGSRIRMLTFVLTVIGMTIYFTHSRAGLGMFGILLLALLAFPGQTSRRRLLVAAVVPVLTIVFFAYPALTVLQLVLVALNADSILAALPHLNIYTERTAGDLERWVSIQEGWQLWLEHPLFGSGLGGYLHSREITDKSFLVIHSVPVWLLAEMGLVGFMVVAILCWLVVRHAFRLMQDQTQTGWGFGLLAALLCIGAGSMVHDFFYQRIFWFFIGLCLALPRPDRGRRAD